ncbi:MAG TPA: ATP-binding protein [Candidatus Bathyarchaeia archaeon]|nr:ATP-binding protein [Candidatus Bathyarchaeia archaeon]
MILDLFRKEVEFKNIEGYDDLKDIVRRALDAEDNYNLLFIGPPASAKTLFLLGILESKKGVYFDGSNTTNRILAVLEEKRPKIICIDELDKMPKQFQDKLLNFMESGHIKVDQMRKQYDFKIKGAKYSQLAMKSQGFQDHCNPDFDAYIYPDIPNSNF